MKKNNSLLTIKNFAFQKKAFLSRQRIPINYITKEFQLKKSWRPFFNPWKVWNSKHFLTFIIGYRNAAKTSAMIRLMFALLYRDPKSRFIFFKRTRTGAEKFSGQIKEVCLRIGIDIKNFKFKKDGIFYYQKKKNGNILSNKVAAILPLNNPEDNRNIEFDPNYIKFYWFDEFISPRFKYLPNEISNFFDLIITMARLRDFKSENISKEEIIKKKLRGKIILTANNLDENTPYHDIFKIPKFNHFKKFHTLKKNNFTYQIIFLNSFKIREKYSRDPIFNMHQAFLKGKDYSFRNQPLTFTIPKIKKIPQGFDFKFKIIMNGYNYGIFENIEKNQIIVSQKYNLSGKKFALTIEDYESDFNIFFMHKKLKNELWRKFFNNEIIFETGFIRKIFIESLQKSKNEENYYKED